MLSIFSVILPIFALVLTGYLSRRMDAIGPTAVSEINRFVAYLALPALLFDVMAHASWSELYQPAFIAAFGLGCGIVFYATVALRLVTGSPLADASIESLNASYANSAYMGFPLCLIVFGRDSLVPVTIASIITVCVLFASAIVLIETGLQTGQRLHHVIGKVTRAVLRNPLIVAPALGTLYAATGLALPQSAETFLKLLGAAASPCALVVLGLFLAEPRVVAPADRRTSAMLTLAKLILQPAVTWVLAFKVFTMPPVLGTMAVLIAALPTGTGPFMLAELYRRPAIVTASTILFSTIGSILTLALFLAIAGPAAH
jgi:predicted permease